MAHRLGLNFYRVRLWTRLEFLVVTSFYLNVPANRRPALSCSATVSSCYILFQSVIYICRLIDGPARPGPACSQSLSELTIIHFNCFLPTVISHCNIVLSLFLLHHLSSFFSTDSFLQCKAIVNLFVGLQISIKATDIATPLTMSPQPAPQIIKAPAVSDGDSNHRPTSDLVFPFDPEVILKTLAFKWMTHLQHAQPGKSSRAMAIGALLVNVMHSLIHLTQCSKIIVLLCAFVSVDLSERFKAHILSSPDGYC